MKQPSFTGLKRCVHCCVCNASLSRQLIIRSPGSTRPTHQLTPVSKRPFQIAVDSTCFATWTVGFEIELFWHASDVAKTAAGVVTQKVTARLSWSNVMLTRLMFAGILFAFTIVSAEVLAAGWSMTHATVYALLNRGHTLSRIWQTIDGR